MKVILDLFLIVSLVTSIGINCVAPRIVHPFEKLAIEKVKNSDVSPTSYSANAAEIYPLDFIKKYIIYRVHLGIVQIDGPSPHVYYTAVSAEDTTIILLADVVDLNNLLCAENITVSSESTALSIAKFLFDTKNLASDYNKMYIICGSDEIPGHLQMLKSTKKAKTELEELKERISVAIDYKKSEIDFLNNMIDMYNKIYGSGIIDLNNIITVPTVTRYDNYIVVNFFTWERIEGAVKKWLIKISTNGIVKGYMYSTVAMFIGNWQPYLGFFCHSYYNYEWGDYLEEN